MKGTQTTINISYRLAGIYAISHWLELGFILGLRLRLALQYLDGSSAKPH